ncbi:MAG: MFS transporter [Candidatus Promineifilaceae bacterium]|nr:MFS transporter [Candidatus Promineifilaceae bacterium]
MIQSVKQIKVAYFAVTALKWLSVAIPLPIFVLFMQSRGIDLFQVGIVMGSYSVVIVLLELPTGGLADAIGRKTVSLLAGIITLFSAIVMFLAFSFAGFLAAMILNGVGRALSSGALDAWFVDSLQTVDPDIDIQPSLAQAGTVTLLALGLGTLVGGFMPVLFSGVATDSTSVFSPYSTTIILAILIKLLLIVAIAMAIKEEPRHAANGGGWRSGFAEVPQIVRESIALSRNSSILLLLMGATLAGGFILAGAETFWQPHFAGILGSGASNSWMFGLIMAVSFLAGVAGNLFSVQISSLLGKRFAWAAAIARGGQGMAFILLATQPTIIPAAFGFWLFYLNMGILNSPHETLVNAEIPAARRSAMLSIQSLASYIGGFLGSVLLGYIAQQRSISSTWIVAAAISMVSLLLYVRTEKLLKRREQINEQSGPIFNHGSKTDAG